MMDELLTDEQIAIKVIKPCIYYQATMVQDSAWCVAHKSNWTTKNLVCDKYEDLLEAARAAVALTRQQIAKSQESVNTAETREQPGLAQEIDALRRTETLVIQQSLISARVTALETSHIRLQEIVRLGNDGKSVKKSKRSKLLKKALINLGIAQEVPDDLVLIYVKWGLEYLYEWQKIASTKKYNEDLRQDLAQSTRTLPIDYRLKEAISCLQNAQKSKGIDTCDHWISAAIGWSLPILYSAETPEPQEKENEDD